MKLPGPDHPITTETFAGRVRVISEGQVLADSTNALLLREASYPPVYYLPRGDIRMDLLAPSRTSSHCPYKGDASYHSLQAGKPDVAWSYDTPYPAMTAISGHLAFYPGKVQIEVTGQP
jgi:uncharacterized protein (DUF427 family)